MEKMDKNEEERKKKRNDCFKLVINSSQSLVYAWAVDHMMTWDKDRLEGRLKLQREGFELYNAKDSYMNEKGVF